MTLKGRTKDTMKSSSKLEKGSMPSRGKDSRELSEDSSNLRELDKLLEAWPDGEDEPSDVHIEHHYHAPVIHHAQLSEDESPGPTSSSYPEEETTVRVQPPPVRGKVSPLSTPPPASKPSLTPKVQRITAIILAVAAGIAGAAKILWDAWQGMKK